MDAITYSKLRHSLKICIDKVFHDNIPLIITRKNNENVVLPSMSEYSGLVETSYLLSNKVNAEHFRKPMT